MRVLVFLLLLLSAPAQAAVYTFRSDPLATGDGDGCADPVFIHCGDVITASFSIDDARIGGLAAPEAFSFAAYDLPERDPFRSAGLLDLQLWLHRGGSSENLSYAVFEPRIETEFSATIGPGGLLSDVSFWVMHDRPDVLIGMGGLTAQLFDDPRADYSASGRWEMTPTPGLVAAPLPPAGLLLGAGALALAALRRRRG